jgi:16S rRNA (guanine527-N7)-methyltransferase
MSDILLHYFPDFSEEILSKLNRLQSLYAYWNERINLISRKDFEHFNIHHLLHSLTIAKLHPFETKQQVLDVGTGGGFPGLPLAIVFPHTQFVLLDSTAKKLKVIEDVAGKLQLKNIMTLHTRVEDHFERYDFIIGRAVKNLPQFYKWTKKNLKSKAFIVYLGGGDQTFSFAKQKKQISLYPYFPESYFESKQLFIFR